MSSFVLPPGSVISTRGTAVNPAHPHRGLRGYHACPQPPGSFPNPRPDHRNRLHRLGGNHNLMSVNIQIRPGRYDPGGTEPLTSGSEHGSTDNHWHHLRPARLLHRSFHRSRLVCMPCWWSVVTSGLLHLFTVVVTVLSLAVSSTVHG